MYARRGCHLCDEMMAALHPKLLDQAVCLQTVDIDTRPELKARFDWDVPLLFAGETEICRHYFDASAFEIWLSSS